MPVQGLCYIRLKFQLETQVFRLKGFRLKGVRPIQQDSEVRQAVMVCSACLVYLVCLAFLVERNQADRPARPVLPSSYNLQPKPLQSESLGRVIAFCLNPFSLTP